MPDIKDEACRFCKTDQDVRGRLCRHCREELRHWSHSRFAGSGLEVPPQEIDFMSKENLDQWREWAKRMDSGDGMYGPSRQSALDDIFDAAWIGMKKARSSRKSLKKTMAAELRRLADQMDKPSS